MFKFLKFQAGRIDAQATLPGVFSKLTGSLKRGKTLSLRRAHALVVRLLSKIDSVNAALEPLLAEVPTPSEFASLPILSTML